MQKILEWLQENYTRTFKVEGGVVTDAVTHEVIPVEHIAWRKIPEDGYYTVSEATCNGGGIPKNIPKTTENIEKYACRVGRPAPKCTAYSSKKCAVYFLRPLNSASFTLSFPELIKVTNL